MEWAKILKYLNIPLKIIIPALWLFSGFLLFAGDYILERLHLLQWYKDNGFLFGLLFVLSSCLVLVFIFPFLKKTLGSILRKLTLKRRTMKKIVNLNDAEQNIITYLYNSPAYTEMIDLSQPYIQGLLYEHLIYTCTGQLVSVDAASSAIGVRCTLQRYVVDTLDKYVNYLQKKIIRLETLIIKNKGKRKESRLREKYDDFKSWYDFFTTLPQSNE